MRNMELAVARSYKSDVWVNRSISWDKLKEVLCNPIKTNETVEEYQRMGQMDKIGIQDVGAFRCGPIAMDDEGRCTIPYFNLMVLLIDNKENTNIHLTTLNATSSWRKNHIYFGYLAHTTRENTDDKMSIRLFIPLSRAVNASEYEVLAKNLANMYDLMAFNPMCFNPSNAKLMPSFSKDGTADYIRKKGNPLDVDYLLELNGQFNR